MSDSECYPKADFSENWVCPKFHRMWIHTTVWIESVKFFDMITEWREVTHDIIKVNFEFFESRICPNIYRMFRSVDWTHDMIIVKWHLFIWHERKLCALTNAPPVQSTQTGQWLSTLFHANCSPLRSMSCTSAIHIRSKLQATIIFAGITIHWALRRIFWKNFLCIWWWQMLWWKHVLTRKL